MKYAFFANKTKTLLLMGWILGIISGTLLFNVLNIESKNNILIYYKYICEKIDFSNVNKIDYFLYILKYRTKEIVICVLFGLTGYRVIFHSGFMWYLGMKNSILIAIFTIAKKQMALFWYIIFTQPQTLLYLYLIYKVIIKMDFDGGNIRKLQNLKSILMCVGGIVTISLIECFVNITILSNFI